jgi:hypothetical protein
MPATVAAPATATQVAMAVLQAPATQMANPAAPATAAPAAMAVTVSMAATAVSTAYGHGQALYSTVQIAKQTFRIL